MKIKENVMCKLDSNRNGFNKLRFDDLYDSVEECIGELINTDDKIIENKCRGYVYMLSFKKQLKQGKTLSDKQITQLKRISAEIARGYYLQNK